MAGQQCQNCNRENPENESYCFVCGHILPYGLQALSTQTFADAASLQPQIRWGTAYFGERSILRIHVHHKKQVVETTFQDECVLGRTVGTSVPTVDLTPYGAVDLGVSRLHARLIRQSATVMVQDMGSVNGTFLNGARLIAHQSRVLRNEDELCLGRLVLRVSFWRAPQAP